MNLNPHVLVLCTGNACRSQMAEGYLRHFGGQRIEVRSAGLESHGLNPRAVAVMNEDGIDITSHTSDRVDASLMDWADLVITVCGHADEHCPSLPSGGEKRHIGFADPAKATGVDLALRGVKSLGAVDVAASYFTGTGREPQFETITESDGQQRLRPVYPRIKQIGLEAQATLGAWLWKLEAIHKRRDGERVEAAVGGFEYTRYGLFDSAADLGLITEYNYDSRGRATANGLGNDLFLGLRWLANDSADSNALVGLMLGLDGDGNVLTVEGGWRLNAQVRLNIEARRMLRADTEDALYSIRGDSYLQVGMDVYF